MNKLLPYFLFAILIFLSLTGQAQTRKDSVVQFYGVVMSADSLRGLDATSVIVEGTGRGTITNSQGVFSIAALKGDKIRFSSTGFNRPTTWRSR